MGLRSCSACTAPRKLLHLPQGASPHYSRIYSLTGSGHTTDRASTTYARHSRYLERPRANRPAPSATSARPRASAAATGRPTRPPHVHSPTAMLAALRAPDLELSARMKVRVHASTASNRGAPGRARRGRVVLPQTNLPPRSAPVLHRSSPSTATRSCWSTSSSPPASARRSPWTSCR